MLTIVSGVHLCKPSLDSYSAFCPCLSRFIPDVLIVPIVFNTKNLLLSSQMFLSSLSHLWIEQDESENHIDRENVVHYLLVFFFSLYREIAESLSWLFNSWDPTFGKTGTILVEKGYCVSSSWLPLARLTLPPIFGCLSGTTKLSSKLVLNNGEGTETWFPASPVSLIQLNVVSCTKGKLITYFLFHLKHYVMLIHRR